MSTASLAREVSRLRSRAPRRRVLVPETPVKLAEEVGIALDDWQAEYLECEAPRRLLNCTRQGGKSTVSSLDATHDALTVPGAPVLIIVPSERQSRETFRKVAECYSRLGHAVPSESERKLGLELLNGSRIEALPGSEKTIRGFSAPRRVIVDEASRVEEEMFGGILLRGGQLGAVGAMGGPGYAHTPHLSRVSRRAVPNHGRAAVPPGVHVRVPGHRRCRVRSRPHRGGHGARGSRDRGVRLVRYWTALDCGQAHDYSAALVMERGGPATVAGPHEIHVTSLDRAPLRTPYPKIAAAVVGKVCELEPVGAFGERNDVGLIIDAGGVGRAVRDLVRDELRKLGSKAPRVHFWPVSATGGGRVSIGGGFINVPKRDLVIAAVVALQDGRLKIGDVPNADLLTRELAEYRMKLTQRGHDTYEGAGRNDDLVYACCLAAWAWSFTRGAQPHVPDRRADQDTFDRTLRSH